MHKPQLSQIYKLHADEVYRFCKYKLGSKEEAEDLTAEVFAALLKVDASEIKNIRAYIFKITRNKIYDRLQLSLQSETSAPVVVSSTEMQDWLDNLPDQEDIEKQQIETALIDSVKTELKKLDPTTADILIYKIWEGMKFNEIEATLGINISTVKQKFYNGVSRLKQNLGEGLAPAVAMGAIYQLGRLSEYVLAPELKNTLFLSLSTINMSTIETIAQAGNTAGSFLSTTGGKAIAVVAGLVVTTTTVVGGYTISRVINPSDISPAQTVRQPEDPAASLQDIPREPAGESSEQSQGTGQAALEQEYTDDRLPGFSIKYDANKWLLEKSEQPSTEGPGLFTYQLTFRSKTNSSIAKLAFNSFFVGGSGPQECLKGDDRYAKLVSADKGVFRFDHDKYMTWSPYSVGEKLNLDDKFGNFAYTSTYIPRGSVQFNQLVSSYTDPQAKEADFCYNLENFVPTNIKATGIVKETNPNIENATAYFYFSAQVDTNQSAADIRAQLEAIDELRLQISH